MYVASEAFIFINEDGFQTKAVRSIFTIGVICGTLNNYIYITDFPFL